MFQGVCSFSPWLRVIVVITRTMPINKVYRKRPNLALDKSIKIWYTYIEGNKELGGCHMSKKELKIGEIVTEIKNIESKNLILENKSLVDLKIRCHNYKFSKTIEALYEVLKKNKFN